MEELSLLWHQRVGVAALVEKIWQADATDAEDNQPGVLIADEVGVGKTVLTVGALAFMIDAYWCQEIRNERLGPDGAVIDLATINFRPAPILGEWRQLCEC